MRFVPLTLCLAVLALGASAATASASTADTIIRDCSSSDTGLLKGSYSKADLRSARKLVRGDIAEYTGCMDAINEALSKNSSNGGNGGDSNTGGGTDNGDGSSGGGFDSSGGGSGSTGGGFDTGGGGGGGSDGIGGGSTGSGTPVTPAPTPAPIQQAGSDAPVAVGGETVTPGIPASFETEGRSLPTPLIAFLVLLAAGAIGFGAPTIGRRVLARRRV